MLRRVVSVAEALKCALLLDIVSWKWLELINTCPLKLQLCKDKITSMHQFFSKTLEDKLLMTSSFALLALS